LALALLELSSYGKTIMTVQFELDRFQNSQKCFAIIYANSIKIFQASHFEVVRIFANKTCVEDAGLSLSRSKFQTVAIFAISTL
jgi:hypothetical protein